MAGVIVLVLKVLKVLKAGGQHRAHVGVEGVRQVQLWVAQLLPESSEGMLLSLLLLVSLGVQIVGISHSLDDLVGHLDGGPDSFLLVVKPLDGLHLEALLLFLFLGRHPVGVDMAVEQ